MDVVMFGFNDWHQWQSEDFRTRCGALARRIATHPSVGKLLVVSTPRSYAVNALRLLRRRPGSTVDSRTVTDPYRPRQVDERVWVLDHTRLLPRDGAFEACYRVNGALHDRQLRRAVLRAVGELSMSDTVLWVSDPLMSKHMGHLGERVSVFDAIDDWSRHPQKRPMLESIDAGYDAVRERADLVFAVSQDLATRFAEARGTVLWQPNGVDAERFSEPRQCPEALVGLPGPIVGYVGTIQERVDPQLVRAAAAAVPEGSVVLVGPVVTPSRFDDVARLANVHFVGPCAATDVPAFVQHFDVCIVPHVDDVFTRSMDPLKIYEYLAAGKPVVAAGVADMGDPPGLVARVDSETGFTCELLRACDESGGEGAERMRFAKERSWDARLDEMLADIECVLSRAEARAIA